MKLQRFAALFAAGIVVTMFTTGAAAAAPVFEGPSRIEADSRSVEADMTLLRSDSGNGAAGGLLREAESMIEDVMPGGEGGAGTTGGAGTSGGNSAPGESGSSGGSNSSGSSGDMAADSSLGDTADGTSGDGRVEGTSDEVGSADGFLGDESDMAGDSGTDNATDTAQSSSGETEDRGFSLMGIVLTLIIIAAVVALLFALMPKRRNS